jgi:uncharacterized protein
MQSNLEKIKEVVQGLIPDSRVILFGSRARNTHDARSDYDLMVVTKNDLTPKEKKYLRSQIRIALAEFLIPADVLLNSEKEMLKKNQLPGHIVRTILNEGAAL